jgi:late competence protein required for DNA uptake (superfamily II DNA/RNA helicase)
MAFRKPLIGRKIICNHCGHKTVKGTARVRRKVLFFFCPKCWLEQRADCDRFMVGVTA